MSLVIPNVFRSSGAGGGMNSGSESTPVAFRLVGLGNASSPCHGAPIHCAFQSWALSKPMCQNPGSLHSEIFPSLSHVRTCHQQSRREVRGLPPYILLTD